MLPIEIEPNRHAEEADFGIRVSGGQMRVPLEVGAVLQRMHIRNAEEFVSYLLTYPSSFLAHLHWDQQSFLTARNRAIQQLRDHVKPELLEADESFRPGYGAMAPPGEGSGKH